VRAEWLRGDVPPGQLGGALVEPIAEEVGRLVTGSAGLRAGVQRHLDVAVALPGGAFLAGTVGGVHGDRVVRIVYSRLSAKHRLRAWVHLLALMAQWPDQPWEAVTVGRGSRGGTIACSRLSGVDPSDAVPRLAALVEVYRLGMCLPLPMPPKTACAYAGKRLRAATPNAAAAFAGQQWRKGSGENEQGEFADVDHQRVWDDAGMSALLEAPADPHDTAWPDEPHRFGQLARRVWTPLLQAETVTET
jgi:exodeoxyribonuclease V gamma subunit